MSNRASGEVQYLNIFDTKMNAIGDACEHRREVTSACVATEKLTSELSL